MVTGVKGSTNIGERWEVCSLIVRGPSVQGTVLQGTRIQDTNLKLTSEVSQRKNVFRYPVGSSSSCLSLLFEHDGLLARDRFGGGGCRGEQPLSVARGGRDGVRAANSDTAVMKNTVETVP